MNTGPGARALLTTDVVLHPPVSTGVPLALHGIGAEYWDIDLHSLTTATPRT